MAATRTFHDVSVKVWEQLKEIGQSRHGTVYSSSDGRDGTATTRTPVGTIVLAFQFDPTTESVTYTIQQKPLLVGESMIWNGINSTLGGCRPV